MFGWIRLPHLLKTAQVYQAINLLAAHRIRAITMPDEFNSACGKERLISLDSEISWPLLVQRSRKEQAIAILKEEQLYP